MEESRSIINGKLLKEHMGENVCIMVKVDTVDSSGKSFKGKTTDDVNVLVNLTDPLNVPIADWVEVIGIPAGQNAIRCKEVCFCFFFVFFIKFFYFFYNFQIILFGKEEGEEDFDTHSHNMLINFMSNCKDFYKIE